LQNIGYSEELPLLISKAVRTMIMISTNKSNSKYSSIIVTVLLLIPMLFNTAHAGKTLILAVHPYLSPEELIKKFTPIANYLSAQTGQTIKVRIGSNYKEHIQYIGENKVDIAYMGPASYVNMTNEFGKKPVLARLEIKGRPWFQGNIITRQDSEINTLDDLKGKRIAYGDPASTMSYIVPHHMLDKAGVFNDPSSKHQFLHSHDNVALGVLSGDFDAGAVKPSVFKKFQAKGLRTIVKTPKISEHLFVTRDNCPTELVDAIRHAMLKIQDSEEGMAALRAIKGNITGLVKADSSDYDNLRKIIIETQAHH
ncbi:MAG: phosphate/phosphite/phosphonate ABC transporter substrate-binding protein, partial [Gammaproteobacteria bacterium]|nr:phosphate/phosphite/phosphonate ABC transporter substrate-binding protein [Gammaproteobacteria bacterium]